MLCGGGGNSLKALTIATLASLVIFGFNTAQAEENDVMPNSVRHLSADEISTTAESMSITAGNGGQILKRVQDDKKWGVPTGFAAEVDPNNIGDTLTGTNHVTYSSTDPGNATGHVEVTNPDGSTQTIYYTYTMPSDYEIKDQPEDRINDTLNSENANNKLFENINTYNSGSAILNTKDSSLIIINSDFNNMKNNKAGTAYGAAIYNTGILSDINGDFISNKSRTYGGAIANRGNINNIKGNFIGNSVVYGGGAIVTMGGVINNIEGNFINNVSGSGSGGIRNANGSYIGNISGNFIKNSSNNLGAIYNDYTSTINRICGNFIGNFASQNTGGAGIYNGNEIIVGIVNSNFYGNYVTSSSTNAHGAAIFTEKTVNIQADNGSSVFKDNYVQVGDGEKDYQAIWVNNASVNLNLQQKNNGKMYMYDNINGKEGYTVNIEGDGSGTIYLFNDIYNANVTLNNTTLNTVNNDIHDYHFNSFTMKGDANFVPDVDLVNEQMDRITANNYGEHTGILNIIGMNMLSDATKDSTEILFAESGLANNVLSKVKQIGAGIENKYQSTAYAPIFKYDVEYNIKENKHGYFKFTKIATKPEGGGSSTPKYEALNPAIMAAPVAAQSAAQVGMNHVFNQAFEHIDGFMPLPSFERMSRLRGNMYAINDVSTTEQLLKPNGLSTDYNDNLDFTSTEGTTYSNKALWVKPYTSFESINLHNGPKVDMISYGTLFGGDSDFRKLKNGWANVGTLYLGYNGAQIDYNDVSSTFNGGVIGITESFYKKNFFTAITANVGAGFAEAHTMYGKDDITMLMAGVASKTGYNFEFKEGKFIIQPSLLLSYSMINTFDYKNAAGVKIDSDPLHTIQLNPNVKFIANLKHEWQPYVSVGMVYNLMNETKVTANNVKLPESSTRPYVEYGIGVQKHFKETFSGYGQAMVRNGGRNGITLTAGFRWALPERKHKDKKDNKNVNKEVNTVVKAQQKVVKKGQPLTRNSNLNDISVRISDPLPKVEGTKTVVKSVKQNSKANNLARYNDLIGE